MSQWFIYFCTLYIWLFHILWITWDVPYASARIIPRVETQYDYALFGEPFAFDVSPTTTEGHNNESDLEYKMYYGDGEQTESSRNGFDHTYEFDNRGALAQEEGLWYKMPYTLEVTDTRTSEKVEYDDYIMVYKVEDIRPQCFIMVDDTPKIAWEEQNLHINFIKRGNVLSLSDFAINWDIDGSGNTDGEYADKTSIEVPYYSEGEYNPRAHLEHNEFGELAVECSTIKIKNEEGSYEQKSTINIKENTGPSAYYSAETPYNNIRDLIYFDTSQLVSDNSATSMRFNFDGDTTWDTPWLALWPVYKQFASSIRYPVYMQVKNEDDETDIYSSEINIRRGGKLLSFSKETKGSYDMTDYATAYPEDEILFINKEGQLQSMKADLFTNELSWINAIRSPSGPRIESAFRILHGNTNRVVDESTTKTPLVFDASQSQFRSVDDEKLRYLWDFNGDGTWDTDALTQSRGQNMPHTYKNTGEYRSTLKIAYESGSVAMNHSTQKFIRVVQSENPHANFWVDTLKDNTKHTFEFDVRATHDVQSKTDSMQYRFDFDGDGTWDTGFASRNTFSHRYQYEGEYDATMQVQDEDGLMDSKSKTITVIPSYDPRIKAQVSPDVGFTTTRFEIDASESKNIYDEAELLDFRYDIDITGDNDTIWNQKWTKSPRYTFRLPNKEPGTYPVRVEIRNNYDKRDMIRKSVRIHWASPYVQTAHDRRIIRSQSIWDVRPDDPVNMAEFVKMVLEASDIDITTNTNPDPNVYRDIKAGQWYTKYFITANEADIWEPYRGGFVFPDKEVNRAQALAIIARSFAFDLSWAENKQGFSDTPDDAWYTRYAKAFRAAGIVSGYRDNTFKPNHKVTRAQAIKMIIEIQNRTESF